ncbi:MAG: DUF3450 domain-containing protein [Cycloclasticus sp.]
MLNWQRKMALVGLSLSCLSLQAANTLDQVIQEGKQRSQDNAHSQHNIDKIADITEKDHESYRQLSQTLGTLKNYNNLLAKQVVDQQGRLSQLQVSLENNAQMQRDILPLIEEMVASLDQFVTLDIPFLASERNNRITQLKQLIVQSDINIAEKFRQVSDAYQIEMEYGRTIESYRDSINLEGTERELSIMRVGRIALLYRSDDGQYLGAWNKTEQQWLALDPSQYDRAIRNGIAMALKQKSPAMINTPIIVDNRSIQKVTP